jgi:zinc/manganese transport system substrate-binding protein
MMLLTRRHLARLAGGLTALAVLGSLPAWAQTAPPSGTLPVITTISVLADITRNVGGDRVSVTSLVGPGGDAHVYQPTPNDARALSAARLVVTNGFGLEGWLNRLISASGFKGMMVVATSGIDSLTMEAEEEEPLAGRPTRKAVKPKLVQDPHAWQNPRNGQIYARNIAAGLAEIDPANAEYYRQRAADYGRQLAALDQKVKAEIDQVPPAKRKVITTHDAFQYLGKAYGIEFKAPIGISTESEPSASGVARLIRQIRTEKIRALFIENMTDPRLMERLAKEAGASIGGTLYSDSLAAPGTPGDTYIGMFENNIPKLVAGMNQN